MGEYLGMNNVFLLTWVTYFPSWCLNLEGKLQMKLKYHITVVWRDIQANVDRDFVSIPQSEGEPMSLGCGQTFEGFIYIDWSIRFKCSYELKPEIFLFMQQFTEARQVRVYLMGVKFIDHQACQGLYHRKPYLKGMVYYFYNLYEGRNFLYTKWDWRHLRRF